jgi:hypothetical protein
VKKAKSARKAAPRKTARKAAPKKAARKRAAPRRASTPAPEPMPAGSETTTGFGGFGSGISET